MFQPSSVVKATKTLVAANSSETGQKSYTVAGLPLSTGLVFATLFVVAFWFYGAVWVRAPVMEPDSWTYLRAAQDLSHFHIDQLQERTPGYPLFLLLTASSQSPKRTLLFVSLSLHFASIWLLASVLYWAGLKEIMLNLFALILLLPPYVEPAAYVLTENLTEAMLVTGFASFVFWFLHKRGIWIFVSALTVGYAALTRPTYQLLALAMAGYLLTVTFLFHWTPIKWRDAVRGSLILLCGSIVMVGGYSYVNYRSFGYFGMTPVLGLTLSQKTFRVLERLPDEYTVVRETLIRGRNSGLLTSPDHSGYDYINATAPELSKITGLQGAQLSDYMLRINLLLIQKAPLVYLQEVVWAFGFYWFPSSGELANMNSRSVQLLWAVIQFLLIGGFFFNMLLLIGAAIYIKMCMRVSPLGIRQPVSQMGAIQLQAFIYSLAGTIVIYSVAITCLTQVGIPRYRVPTDSLIVFMLFLGTLLWRRLVDLSRTVLCYTQTVLPSLR
jgi:hypothetical protein